MNKNKIIIDLGDICASAWNFLQLRGVDYGIRVPSAFPPNITLIESQQECELFGYFSHLTPWTKDSNVGNILLPSSVEIQFGTRWVEKLCEEFKKTPKPDILRVMCLSIILQSLIYYCDVIEAYEQLIAANFKPEQVEKYHRYIARSKDEQEFITREMEIKQIIIQMLLDISLERVCEAEVFVIVSKYIKHLYMERYHEWPDPKEPLTDAIDSVTEDMVCNNKIEYKFVI